MKEYIFNIAVYMTEMLISYTYFSDISSRKIKSRYILLIGVALFLPAAILNFRFNNIALNILSFVLINIVFSLLCFEINLLKAVINTIILEVIVTISESAVLSIISAFTETAYTSYQDNFTIYFLDVLLSKMLYFIICKVCTRISSYKSQTNGSPLYLLIYPVSTMVMLVILRIVLSKSKVSSELNTSISVISFIMLLSVIVIYVFYNNSIKKDNELFALRNEIDKIEINDAYNAILEHQNDELHRFAHDTKNHLITIKALSDNETVDEYIDKIYDDLKKISVSGKTKNKILDMIINKYSILCEINNIKFITIVKTANLDFIENSDLSTLLNNLLDNALEAAKKSNEKTIELSINRKQTFDVLTCINSCDMPPVTINKNLATTKKDKKLHGYGTKSIMKIAQKYSGNYQWDYDDNLKEFTTTIVFNH